MNLGDPKPPPIGFCKVCFYIITNLTNIHRDTTAWLESDIFFQHVVHVENMCDNERFPSLCDSGYGLSRVGMCNEVNKRGELCPDRTSGRPGVKDLLYSSSRVR